ncbi:hypothetical protein CGK32_22955, partial [Vibrio parahaemolyticus]|uniref:phage baseplate protein n=1 Tax=Vibrio parahaemolyticus TaxID=670 RepID=UPI001120DDB0
MANGYNVGLGTRTYLVENTLGFGEWSETDTNYHGAELVLDATSNVKIRYAADATNFHVNSNTDSTDHVKLQPRIVTFDGVISNDAGLVEFIGDALGVLEPNTAKGYHQRIRDAFMAKRLWAAYIPNVGVINNCVITNAVFQTDKNLLNAFKVSLVLKEIRVAEDGLGSPMKAYEDVTAPEQVKSNATTTKISAPLNEAEPIAESPPIVGGTSVKSLTRNGI